METKHNGENKVKYLKIKTLLSHHKDNYRSHQFLNFEVFRFQKNH